MDRCTGQTAIQFRAAALTVEESFARLQLYRFTALAACAYYPACPAALQVFNGLLGIEKTIQIGVKGYWTEQKYKFLLARNSACSLHFSSAAGSVKGYPFRVIKETQYDRESLNEETFSLPKLKPISISLHTGNKFSTAELKREGTALYGFPNQWSVRWTQ
jgi:hypothetical protein